MSTRDDYPAGVPCWVETLQPDPRAALGFYLLGWEFGDAGPMPAGLPGEYFVAEVDGRRVAGVGALLGPAPAVVRSAVLLDSGGAAFSISAVARAW